jgi:peptide/nickel transport system substrate-binding protein
MKHLFQGGRRKMAAVMAVALVASLSQVAPSSAAPAAKKSGGEITVGVFNSLLSSCFSPNASNSALGMMRAVYEGFFEQQEGGRVVPYLAAAMTPSADFKTWDLKLRPNVKFHDGTSLDAAAAITNIEATRGYYFASFAARGTPGAALHTLSSGIPFAANIKKVSAVAADVVRYELWNPQVDFDESSYASGRQFIRALSDLTNPSQCATAGKGTGPFMFQKLTPTEVVLVRNPNYWRKDKDGVQLPYLDKITFKYVNQASQRVKGLQSGTLDAVGFTSAGEAKHLVNVKSVKGATLLMSPPDYYAMSMFNHAIEPFNNLDARLAVAYAFDTQTFYKQRNCFKGTCFGEVPSSMVGPRNIMYNKKGFVSFNLAKAKQHAAKYTAATGKTLTFSQPADVSADSQASAKLFQQMMKKAGITMNISTEDTATITAKAFPTPGTGFNSYQLYPTTLFEGTGTSFTLPFIQSNSFRAPGNLTLAGLGALAPTFGAFGAVINPGRVADPEQDKLVWAAQYSPDKASRTAKLKAVTEYVQKTAGVLPAPSIQYGFAFNSKVKGYNTFTLASGGRGKAMTNAGAAWVGVYLEK